jgi:NADH:ubiquinone reductase (H+-translocating)
MTDSERTQRVVVVGGGFGGLYAAKSLARAGASVTLIDRRNFHLFQPLLYQIATGGTSPGDICSPLRSVLAGNRNTRVLQAEVAAIDTERREVLLADGRIAYDTLIVAAGSHHHYFGHEEWARDAPGLKTVEDAIEIRRRIFSAFERAEREDSAEERRAWMTFVIVGGGPTGVELAGALAELSRFTLPRDFRAIDTREARIVLIEAMDRLLPPYPPGLSRRAERALSRLGVTVAARTSVAAVDENGVTAVSNGIESRIGAKTVIWAAGVRASALGRALADSAGAELDRAGRVIVREDLTLPSRPEIIVIGDLAHVGRGDGTLPGTAPVAIQQGRYAARLVRDRIAGRTTPPFRYRNKGSLAVIGRNAAVADFGRIRLWGYPAWFAWVFVHIWYLIEFDNKLIVMIQWAFDYFTRKRGARLIT